MSIFYIKRKDIMRAKKMKKKLSKIKKIAGYTSTFAAVGILLTTLVQKVRKKKDNPD